MLQEKRKSGAWLSFAAVLLFLGFIFWLDQAIKPTDKLGMLLIVLQKGSVYALAAGALQVVFEGVRVPREGAAGFLLVHLVRIVQGRFHARQQAEHPVHGSLHEAVDPAPQLP